MVPCLFRKATMPALLEGMICNDPNTEADGGERNGASSRRLILSNGDHAEVVMSYALFDRDRRIGEPMPTELDVWKHALRTGLISDLPVADEEGGQVLPAGFHVKRVAEPDDPKPDWKLPREIS